MNSKQKSRFTAAVTAAVFFLRLILGFLPAKSEPGFIPGGAMNEPVAVLFSAAISGALAFVLLQALFWLYAKFRNK